MRNAMPRVDDVGGDVDGPFRVPVPVVADIPVPRDHLAARYEGVAWAPVGAGAYPSRAVPTSITRAPERVGLSGSAGQTQTGQAQTASHRHRGCEPRNSVHGWFPFMRRRPVGVASAIKCRPPGRLPIPIFGPGSPLVWSSGLLHFWGRLALAQVAAAPFRG